MHTQKTMLITGAGKGLGKAISTHFAKNGYCIIAHYRNTKPANLAELKKHTPASFCVRADLASETHTARMFKEIYKTTPRIDVLVNNVGDFIFKDINTTTFSDFKNVIESNLYSAFLCAKEVLPAMQKKRSGSIVMLGCAGAYTITIRKNTTPYYIAKTGVIMLTKALAAENQKYNIRINAVSPGILPNSRAKPIERKSQEIQYEDIISAIEFLLSEKAKKITGANIEVSAGWVPGFE
jgi:NAD(P)-dependent dehydrogenase (short-subunit alcohol dehydrogenase family)